MGEGERRRGGGEGESYMRTHLCGAHGLLWAQGLFQIKTYWFLNVYGKELMLGPEGLYKARDLLKAEDTGPINVLKLYTEFRNHQRYVHVIM